MASSLVERMPETVEAYKVLAQRDLELIMDQKAEIERLVRGMKKDIQKSGGNRRLEDLIKKYRK